MRECQRWLLCGYKIPLSALDEGEGRKISMQSGCLLVRQLLSVGGCNKEGDNSVSSFLGSWEWEPVFSLFDVVFAGMQVCLSLIHCWGGGGDTH